MIRGSPGPEFARKAREFAARTAIVSRGQSYSYADLLQASESAAGRLLLESGDLREERVVFMVPPGFGYAAVQWGIWRAGGVAVPLSSALPPAECEHIVSDSRPAVVVGGSQAVLRPLASRFGCRFRAG
jgi:malonyl-CoA/methylmalonyl-CoA synthetase